MEFRRKYFNTSTFIWITAIIHMSILTNNLKVTAGDAFDTPKMMSEDKMDSLNEFYIWSSWGSWSACSRTCGGGVAVQERQCLPKEPSRIVVSGTLAPPVISVRVSRQARNVKRQDCPGVARRYHQCNTRPCPGTLQDTRAQQCEAFDRRPFRGRFYTWVPYVDGSSPCTLNCRPLGQQFYASLALAADGTACTKPGFRAICVEGICKRTESLQLLNEYSLTAERNEDLQ